MKLSRIIIVIALLSLVCIPQVAKAVIEPISFGIVVVGGLMLTTLLTTLEIGQIFSSLSSGAMLPITPGTGPNIPEFYPDYGEARIKPYTDEDVIIANEYLQESIENAQNAADIGDAIIDLVEDLNAGVQKTGYTYSPPSGYYYFTTKSYISDGFRNTYIEWARYPSETISMMLVGIEDIGSPTVSVMSPDGGEIWYAGQESTISWSASDNAGVNRKDIYYSVDDGKTWQIVVKRLENTGSYTWMVPNLPSSQVKIKIEAFDYAGNKASDTSDQTFTILSARARGIDVSHHQNDKGPIDWLQVKNAGYDFAFVKATGATGYTDPYFTANMEGASTAGLLVGAYHFAYPEYNDAVSEAQHFINVAGAYLKKGYLRPALDLEDDPSENSYPYRMGRESLSNWIHLWMDTVESETGVEPIMYTGWYAREGNYLDALIAEYDLWIADYVNAPPDPPNIGIWSTWAFWQYSDKGSVQGINGNVDLDIFNGDRVAIEEFLITKISQLNVFMLVDLSGSFADDLPIFKTQAPNMISNLMATYPNARFGLGKFEDYPIWPFGDAASGDKAYERIIDLTSDTDTVLSCISSLFTRYGADGPQSQLPALYQAATGAGQDLSGVGFPGASIPPGQQANFRDGATKLFILWTDAPFHNPGDPGTIPYPGPSFDQTVEAIKALDPPMVIGISSGSGGVADLRRMAIATGALAPAGGVDTNGDGIIDILEGEPLVCAISSSGYGIAEAIEALVGAAAILPIADASGPYEGEVGKAVTLDGSGSFDSDGYIALYEWDFEGDGVFDFSSAESTTSHIYATAFTGVVILRVTDNDGNTDTDEATITIVQTDNIPPSTTLEIGEPKHVDPMNNVYVTSATRFTLAAEDNHGGMGVASIFYRIYNSTFDTGWLEYSAPFYLTGLADGEYSIDYYSIDTIGNTEATNTATVILDNTPPSTTLTIGEPKYISDTTYVTPDAPFTLEATDTGSGIYSTAYRIYNTTYDSGWQTYITPFYLTSLTDGAYTIEYNSTDNVQNTETTHAINLTLFSWNYVYQDTYGRGTTLKINPAHRIFQFITPGKDYGIRNATYMQHSGKAIRINHHDEDLRLITVGLDTNLDLCLAMAWDVRIGSRFLLVDKFGQETRAKPLQVYER